MKRSVIVSSSVDFTDSISAILQSEGYSTVHTAACGNELRRSLHSEAEPELAVIDCPLPDEFGQELALRISETTSAAVLLICGSYIRDDLAEKVSDSGIAVASKPINRQKIINAVRSLSASRSRMMGLKKENAGLLTKIDEMRLINRAKCTLMEYLKFTEPQAHRYIEKQAMNTRQTRREVALRILATYER
ncbi:MAG: ANTAR domain-containing protein [Ruminococcus sp.]|nr:ANTAR domain-containing protein [Ruminococcus sp.]HRR78226.1 ANTAR domain-containing protein [Ruminococcus sp.]